MNNVQEKIWKEGIIM